jgi:hypothetical protein
MPKEYTIEDIKVILKKIENVKERKHVEKIKEIIYKENENLSVTKKSDGILLFFHNLNQSTYKKLDIFFDKIDNEKILKATSYSESLNMSTHLSISDNTDTNQEYNSPQIKLSNTEKKILKKKEYHKQIYSDNNKDDVYVNDEIFYNKNKKV